VRLLSIDIKSFNLLKIKAARSWASMYVGSESRRGGTAFFVFVFLSMNLTPEERVNMSLGQII
jgi:hypothetical protein